MAPPSPTTLRLTRGTTLFLSTFISAIPLSLSVFVVPRLLESPSTDTMLTGWLRTYNLGAATMPFAAAAATAGYLFLGLRTPGISLCNSRLYLAAAGLTVGIVPYTILLMKGTNGRLMVLERRAREVEEKGEVQTAEVRAQDTRTAKGLLDWWGVLNVGRSVMLAGGAVLGLVATL